VVYTSIIDRSDAGALIAEDVSRVIVQGVAESSALMRLATRAPDMPRAQRRIPVLSVLPVAYFVTSDTGLQRTTEQAWVNKSLNAEEIACIVPIPESVLDDADYGIWGEVRPRIVEAIVIVFDSAVLFGTNAPASWPTRVRAAALAFQYPSPGHRDCNVVFAKLETAPYLFCIRRRIAATSAA
jgi:HK97 family phage major capsid protein